MRMPPVRDCVCMILLLGFGVGCATAQTKETASDRVGLGSTPPEELIRAWNIDISPDGENLPEGSGSVAMGKRLYEQQCIACHGDTGQRATMDQLTGGQGSLDTQDPLKTVGSYWPYATTLFDYTHRAMPFNAPQTLTPDEVYAITAYVLNLNGIVPDDAVMDENSLPQVQMPNRGGFKQTNTVTKARTTTCMAGCTPLAVDMAETSTDDTIEEEQIQ